MSEPIQAIATNNYLLATPIGSGYMETSALEYDGDKISGYSGSAFKAGDEFPQSATDAIGYVTATSANIDSTIDNVSANSGAWGGSALPISAGPGIKFDMVDGTLVASTDETVLFSGSSNSTINLTESPLNFETIRVFYHASTGDTDMGAGSHEFQPNKTHIVILTNKFMWKENQSEYVNMNEALLSLSGVNTTSWGRMWGGWHNVSNIAATALNNSYDFLNVSKVIGINRIAGGN